MKHPIVLAMTGASGAVYGCRLLEVLLAAEYEVHLAISPSGEAVLKQEMNLELAKRAAQFAALFEARPTWWPQQELLLARESLGLIHYHHYQDFMTPIASGSFLTAGMVVCPCSGSTLSSIAQAAGNNLIVRAADVHLKERRKLIVVPRETPLSSLQIDNMHRLSQAGAIVLPAMPGWYHQVQSLADLVDFVVARILDQLGVEHRLMRRWGDV